jgi:hypothetical protein
MADETEARIDLELVKIKDVLERLRKQQAAFGNCFRTLPPHDRAKMLRRIQNDQKTVYAFLSKTHGNEIKNTGTKFAIENTRASFSTLQSFWRKIEKELDTFSMGGGDTKNTGTSSGTGSIAALDAASGETDAAIDKYSDALRAMGQNPTQEHLAEFKTRLSEAYKTAQQKSGTKDLAIEVVREGEKIKVRMKPK